MAIAIGFLVVSGHDPAAEPGTTAVASSPPGSSLPAAPLRFANQEANVAYVGGAACAGCHRAQHEAFSAHGKARTFAAMGPDSPLLADWASPEVVVDQATGLRYQPYREGDRFYIRETLLDESGREIHSLSREIHYALGSGRRGRAYVHQANGFLRLLPVQWYASEARWDLVPFYEVNNQRFSHRVNARCLGCHNEVPDLESEGASRFALPLPDGISCERCHGPGAAHVDVRRAGLNPVRGEVDTTIVNPRHLPAARQIDICAQCHLQGEAEVLRPGGGEFDFRPGGDLAAHRAVFVSAGAASDTANFGFVRQVERLARSRCYTESAGAMTCTTCHDPHRPSADRPVAARDAACRQCHAADDCSLAAGTDGASGSGALTDCAGCHMRRSAAFDLRNFATTDHWIRRRIEPPATDTVNRRRPDLGAEIELFRLPGEGRPQSAEDLELLAVASADLGLASAARTALLNAASVYQDQDQARLIEELRGAERPQLPGIGVSLFNAIRLAVEDPELAEGAVFLKNPLALNTAALLLAAVGDSAAARITLERAVVGFAAPPRITAELARLDAAMGDVEAGSVLAAEAVSRDPNEGELRGLLADITAMRGLMEPLPADQLAAVRLAVERYRRALDLDPENHQVLFGLARSLMRSGNLKLAAPMFAQVTTELPFDVDGYASLGYCLSALGRPARAVESLERARALDAESPTIHFNLGNSQSAAGDTEGAEASYREAIRLAPDYYQAHGNLGLLLRDRGDREGARREFERVLEIRPGDELAERTLEELSR